MAIFDLKTSRRSFLALTAAAALTAAFAGVSSGFAAKQNLLNGVAIQGYDPVAYFTQGAAVEGNADFSTDHNGAIYHFASAENRDAFLADPSKYAPQYGGFCAYAVAKGATAPIDPQAFTVVDDKLYLNFSKGVRSTWATDIPGNVKSADANWPSLSGE